MPNWYWEKKELRCTPSQAPQNAPASAPQSAPPHAPGSAPAALTKIDYETEMRYRREGARFIIELGKKLNLSHNSMATGAVYFHRFYMFHSFLDFPKYVSIVTPVLHTPLSPILSLMFAYFPRLWPPAACSWLARPRRPPRSART